MNLKISSKSKSLRPRHISLVVASTVQTCFASLCFFNASLNRDLGLYPNPNAKPKLQFTNNCSVISDSLLHKFSCGTLWWQELARHWEVSRTSRDHAVPSCWSGHLRPSTCWWCAWAPHIPRWGQRAVVGGLWNHWELASHFCSITYWIRGLKIMSFLC